MIRVNGKAGHFWVATRAADQGRQVPHKVGISRLKYRVSDGAGPSTPVVDHIRIGA